MDEREKDDYQFVNEQIKKKPADRKEIRSRLLRSVVFGAVFGVCAALAFCVASSVFGGFLAQRGQRVDLPGEEEEPLSAEKEPEPDPVYITEKKQMELSDYQVLQNKLYGIGMKANRSVVAVTGVKSAKDWFDSDYETNGQGAGILIADTDQQYLIVTEKKLIADAKQISVSFYDGASAEAELVAYDGNTGIAVLRVEKRALGETTRKQIRVAELGSSGLVTQGSMVIAVGSPLGETYSILTGNVTASNGEVTTTDANYRVISTDIVGSANGSGALLDLEGRVIGLIMQGYGGEENRGTVTAIGISELRGLIEGLSNGERPVYLGMEISTVTDEIAAQFRLPLGVYVKNVRMDSPAIEAGLQAGDVIVEMDGEEIRTEAQYESFLQGCRKGQEIEITVRRMGADETYQSVKCNPVVKILK